MENEQEIKEIVIARLKTLPADKSVSVGSEGDFSREALIEAVEKDSDVGKKIIEVEMSFLRSLKEGNFYDE